MLPKLLLVAATGLAIVAIAAPGHAQRKRDRDQGTVKVCSTYGNGCTSAPIRRAANDYEFRMPGGTWFPCRQSCKDTLRREVLDFWETQRENAGDKQ
jgi:hypothetical protein